MWAGHIMYLLYSWKNKVSKNMVDWYNKYVDRISLMYYEHVILLCVLVYLSWVFRKPISQFDLFNSYFRPVSTLSILTVFLYIYRWLQVSTGLGDGSATRDEDGGSGGPCDMYLSMLCICVCMRMLYKSWDNMYVFDMVIYVGMCPNSCMLNDVLCIVTCECYCLC